MIAGMLSDSMSATFKQISTVAGQNHWPKRGPHVDSSDLYMNKIKKEMNKDRGREQAEINSR
jgi:hypothetical protein